MKNILRTTFLKGMITLALLGGTTQTAQAFVFEVEVVDAKAIKALSDDDLSALYLDVIIEFEASKAFYVRAGFTPKEYRKYKDLIRFRYNLIKEMQRRELDIPSLDF